MPLLTLALCASILPAAAQSSDLDRVLELAGRYLLDYERQLTAVVAEEQYDQWVEAGRTASTTSTGRMRESASSVVGPSKRTLVSDFLMIRWPGDAAWFGFRDVLSVDGRPVRDREERLLKLFTQNPKDVLARADLIAAESARYNIGGVARNINVPTQALDFLHPRYRSRFGFRRGGTESIEGRTVLKVEFEEREKPYLISTLSGAGIPARGIAWIDPSDGVVMQTQLDLNIAESRMLLRSRITVSYRMEEGLGLRVPAELRERHEQSDPASRFGPPTILNGRAVYNNFRRFGTETREELVPGTR
jgi:hypothetical protein